MKNTLKIMLFVAVATLTFISCNKENTPAVQQDTVLDITIDYANFSGNDTKATKTAWENGDLVYMVFSEESTYDYKNYVKMEYNGGKWKVVNPAGQEVLNKLKDGSGTISACHHIGIKDPALSTDEITGLEENVFTNDNKACFALVAYSSEYNKSENYITATLNFKPIDEFQFNIKGLDFKDGKYSLNIYKGSQIVLRNSFGNFSVGVAGFTPQDGPDTDIPAQKGFDKNVKEISFFVKLWQYHLDYTEDYINNTWILTYSFNPTFELVVSIEGTNYYLQRTIPDKKYTSYKAYSLEGPTANDAQIQAAEDGADLGKGWKKVIKHVVI